MQPLSILCHSLKDIDAYTMGFPRGNAQGQTNIFRAVKHCLPGPVCCRLTVFFPSSLRSKICISMFEILVTDDVLHFCWKYTFILPASKGLPKQCVKYGAAAKYATRKDVGVRIPDDAICQAILGKLDSPLISTRLIQAKLILRYLLFNCSCFINNLYTTIFQCQMA